MTLAKRDSGQYASEATALLITGGAAVVFLIASPGLLRNAQLAAADRDPGVELTLQSADVPALSTPPAPPVKQRLSLRRESRPSALAAEPPPIAADPAPEGAESFTTATSAPASAPSTYTHPDDDARYSAALRADIDRRTHPPDSVQYRLRHPAGEARVRFVVMRSGEPHDVELAHSSGSSVLDDAALNIVRSGHYAPMPAKAFVGQSQHTFVVTIEFRPLTLSLRRPASQSSAA
jgi:TonB family protein